MLGHLEGKHQSGHTAADYQDIGLNIGHVVVLDSRFKNYESMKVGILS